MLFLIPNLKSMSEPNQHTSIKSWAEDDRPREKLIAKGKIALSDSELTAILIGSGTRDLSAVDLAKQILQSVNNDLNQLGRLNVKELCKFKGIGEAKAISIITALELGKRRRASESVQKPKISSSKDAFIILQPFIGDLHHEEFWILFLSNANKVLKKEQLSIGGMTGTVADVRKIYKSALEQSATAIIIAHNHPSGTLRPSQADIQLTKKVKDGGSILDIKLLDHLIITEKNYYSFADEGTL
jgi:DNA repair protein RadC